MNEKELPRKSPQEKLNFSLKTKESPTNEFEPVQNNPQTCFSGDLQQLDKAVRDHIRYKNVCFFLVFIKSL